MTTKICKKCGRRYYGNPNSKYCSIKCGRRKDYYDNKEKILKKQKKYRKLHPEKERERHHKHYLKNKEVYMKRTREWEKKHPKRSKEKNKKAFNKFITEKREQFNHLIMNNYYDNKDKWRKRNYVNIHREEFLELLPKECANCGKKPIKIISHITYDVPKRKKTRQKHEELKKYLIEYSKVLLPFCSKKCLSKWKKK